MKFLGLMLLYVAALQAEDIKLTPIPVTVYVTNATGIHRLDGMQIQITGLQPKSFYRIDYNTNGVNWMIYVYHDNTYGTTNFDLKPVQFYKTPSVKMKFFRAVTVTEEEYKTFYRLH